MKKNITFLAVFFLTSGLLCGWTADKVSAYRLVSEKKLAVTADTVNVRIGPGLEYPVIGVVSKEQELSVLGAFGEWYLVCLPNGSVGIVSGLHTSVTPDNQAELLFRLVNQERTANELPDFTWDEDLNKIARLKAQDMLDNDYFGHSSPQYGTPFAMLKQMGILYKSASENIAGSESVQNAHASIMESPSHRSNILSAYYNKVGIGIVDGGIYGKIIVQLFVEE